MDTFLARPWIVAPALLAILVTYSMGLFSRKNHLPVDGKTVLLTGASEGMGRSIALMLAAKGANVVAVARNPQKLEALIAELKAAAKNPQTQRFTYFPADVSVEDYAAPLVEAATKWNEGRAPDICWAVAGVATLGYLAETDFALVRKLLHVNYLGQAELAHAITRAWTGPSAPTAAQHGRGPRHLIFTSTSSAFWPVPGYAPYAPAKAALRSLADILSHEFLLYPEHDLRVHIVYPGTMTSPGFERENQLKPRFTYIIEEDDPVQTPDEAAAAAFRGLEMGQYGVATAWLGHCMKWLGQGGSPRNSVLVDGFMSTFMAFAAVLIVPIWLAKAAAFGKKYGHPKNHPPPGPAK